MVKDEPDEMPKETQAQNGLENSEKGNQEQILILSLKRHGEEGSGRPVPDQPGDKNWSTIVYGEKNKKTCEIQAFKNGKEKRGRQFEMKIKKSPFLSGSHAAPTFSAHHCSNHPGRFYI